VCRSGRHRRRWSHSRRRSRTCSRSASSAWPTDCFGAPAGPTPRLHVPALGLSSDYLLTPEPYTVVPDPDVKELGSLAYTKAGVDTGEIVIRGGTHYEFGDVPTGAIPASRRGIDLVTWYTLAWFDRYLKDEASADARLLTTRWRDDGIGGSVDPSHDPNLFSYHYRSRLDVHLVGGGTFDCDDLRVGCAGQVEPSADCGSASFSYLAVDTGESPVTCTPSERLFARRKARRSHG
jgi:hypothetical protein